MTEEEGLLKEFLMESETGLRGAETGLKRLAEVPGDREAVATVFRAVHSLAGAAGFFNLPRLEGLAREGEAFLKPWRNGAGAVTGPARLLAAELIEVLRGALAGIEAASTDAGLEAEDLRSRLRAAGPS
jgi:two-component system chemotaxis sensor kinase CheA